MSVAPPNPTFVSGANEKEVLERASEVPSPGGHLTTCVSEIRRDFPFTLSSSALRGLEPRPQVQPIAPRVHDLELVEPPRASRRNTPASTSPAAARSRRATTARPHPTTRAAPARTRLQRARAATAGEEPPLRCAARTTAESASRRALDATHPQPPHGDPARHGPVISFSRRSGGISPAYTCFLLFMCDNEIMNHDLAICRRQITFG